MADEPLISTFIVEREKLNESELYKILLYCGTKDDPEGWEVDINAQYNMVNGCSTKDTGKFWEFLKQNGLADRIEIVRG